MLLLVTAACLTAQEEARLLRYPHIQGDRIAFVHGGDIWTASSDGGPARRVTSFDEGYELFPRISPDGKWIAFSAEYGGSRQVYVVPYEGGLPRQVTFYPDVGPMPPRGGYDNLPLDWTADGSRILIKSNRTPYGVRISRYFLVDPSGAGLARPLPVPEGGPASLSPDGKRLAYNIISREWRTWKRYQAGRAQDVHIYDLAGNAIERITSYSGTDNFPMWIGERIYFTSDRTGTLNLWCHDLASGKQRQITTYTEYDVLFPSRGQGGLIFESGGWLHVMDTRTEKVRRLHITLADDRPWLRSQWKDVSKSFASHDLSPSGKRVVIEARGELFSVPAEKGQWRNLTATPARRERGVSWSPDGKQLAYLAEAGDRYELFFKDLLTGKETQVTRDSDSWILNYAWSPDGKYIAMTDKAHRLRIMDVESREVRTLDRSPEGGLGNVVWSADGTWLAYGRTSRNGFQSVWMCPVENGESFQVTSDDYMDGSPTFDTKGRYLFFTSARDFKFDGFEFNPRIYALLLQKDATSPVAPEDDREEALDARKDAGKGEKDTRKEDPDGKDESKADPDEAKPDKGAKDEPQPLVVDREGLAARLVVLPVSGSESIRGLTAVDDGLLFVSDGKLQRYDLKKRETKTVLEGVRSYRVTPKRDKLIYRYKGGLCIAKPTAGQKAGKGKVPLTGLQVKVEPRTEWRQMYEDAWRIMGEWFYDPKHHAVDWHAIRDRYAPLVAHASHRSDLDFILGEMIGELNCGHTYVQEGETPKVDRVRTGVLGCEFAVEHGRFRIAKIYPGENWNESTRAPLTEPGVDAREGDYLLAIDGVPLTAPGGNPYRLLENKVGRQVKLTLNEAPSGDGSRETVVRPVASEQGLRHLAWLRNNRRIVEELSGGRIGYVHVPDTAVDGHRELFRHFRPQARVKEAMIIDDRYNGGGWIPDRMVTAMGQKVLNYWARRNSELSTTPSFAFDGPMLMLINGYSSSGGDALPYYFRKRGLGPLMGKTTWGGLVGYSGSPRLVDGGGLAVPAFAFVNVDGKWDVEAVGVAPDIEVFDDPTKITGGREPMLEAAIAHLLKALKTAAPRPRPSAPEGPRRN